MERRKERGEEEGKRRREEGGRRRGEKDRVEEEVEGGVTKRWTEERGRKGKKERGEWRETEGDNRKAGRLTNDKRQYSKSLY